jgi:hypothetical protein
MFWRCSPACLLYRVVEKLICCFNFFFSFKGNIWS